MKFIVLDQDDLGGTILTYPRRKLVLKQPVEIPLYGTLKGRQIHKEELLSIFKQIVFEHKIDIVSGCKVESITKLNGYFKRKGSSTAYKSQFVLLAIGRRGAPRKLGVPGEKSEKVCYKLLEPEQFAGCKTLVVGGG